MARLSNHPITSQRQAYEQQYRISRSNLLAVVLFTAINLVLLATNSNVYFLFSAYIPQYILSMGMYLTGKFPPEYYAEELVFLDESVFLVALAIAAIVTLIYLVAWIMSKNKRSGWLKLALGLFLVDTLLMLDGFTMESVLDLLFHIWVVYYLILGIRAAAKLKKLPEEPEADEVTEEVVNLNSPVLREADMGVKHRVLAEASVKGYDICYRRVKRTNELVINGRVYDEYTALSEMPHILSAELDGHRIEVGLQNSRSFINFDGETVAKKMRLY